MRIFTNLSDASLLSTIITCLWLLEIPHLSFLAVPMLNETVFPMSMDDGADGKGETSATTPSEISNATKPKRAASSGTSREASYKHKADHGKQVSSNNMHRQQPGGAREKVEACGNPSQGNGGN
jgi:hypothetical protein